ncbi:tetratricopeptide repeat protein 10, tpr10, putative [Perkinsus marinus ATCC 50983]|uniref:Tetratricopeptide repeat protein 10, tpr10, putative n=1 Tax=Perkinsus marinus (strain ATCC 50983 / TXsc) TaxID=423536 RepID=C5KVS9_PERM5|nr:tetratricopeptide repeat protein 10, tpr10, putative [Perkinsus marinus ATCC 50983]EER11464.1 tetratricopeptide repeat protein 10, tpr10, putative [Perkinsus marinus ATCC 50983]|eukprot:XP_002779669.1 tetratricopeptide repeat protein 10, tpr10, putative [Perkinsus marinus ATCC 50983]
MSDLSHQHGDPTLYDDNKDDDDDEEDEEEITKKESKMKDYDNVDDPLGEFIHTRIKESRNIILQAAELIAPVLGRDENGGDYDWVIDTLYRAGYRNIAAKMEINKAHYYLKHKQFHEAIITLKSFQEEQQEGEEGQPNLNTTTKTTTIHHHHHTTNTTMAAAATNLSFIYFQEGNYKEAERYADMAIKIDRYNCEALVNKGNCLFVCNELYRAKELYLEAIGVASYCLEAIYNLGLVCKQACEYNEALIAFTKLQEITKNNCDVLWQLGDIYHKISNYKKAHEYLSLILTQGMARGRPNDPTVLARIGELYEIEGNEVEAYHNYMESYRNWPLDLTVITWLGVYYVKKDLFESAIPLFKRASDISPSEPKWMLMIASCYRRMGNQQKAYNMYVLGINM